MFEPMTEVQDYRRPVYWILSQGETGRTRHRTTGVRCRGLCLALARATVCRSK